MTIQQRQQVLATGLKDARFSGKGKYSAWLSKEKKDGAAMKFLNSSVKRYFTIDFDLEAFYYAHGESQRDITAFIPFKEILEVTRGSEAAAPQPPTNAPRGLRRSLSSSLLGKAAAPPPPEKDFSFIVKTTTGRRLQVFAESAAEQTAWIMALSTARKVGKPAAGSARRTSSPECPKDSDFKTKDEGNNNSSSSCCSGSTCADCSSEAGRSEETSSETARSGGSTPPHSETPNFTTRHPLWNKQAGGFAFKAEPRAEEAPSPSAKAEASEHAEPQLREAKLPQGTEDAAAKPAEPEATTRAAEAEAEKAPKALEAADFGFDDDEEPESRAPSCEPSPRSSAPAKAEKANATAATEASAPAPPRSFCGVDAEDVEECKANLSPDAAARIAADLNLLKRPAPRAVASRATAAPKQLRPAGSDVQAASQEAEALHSREPGDDAEHRREKADRHRGDRHRGEKDRTSEQKKERKPKHKNPEAPAAEGDADADPEQAARIAADLALLGKVPRPVWNPPRAGAA